jgi:hypothetical protein
MRGTAICGAMISMVRFDRDLVRRRDGKAIGKLSIIRTDLTKLHDERGQRLVTPEIVDSLIIAITNPLGEQVVYQTLPFKELTRDDVG